jgi:uncharacterized protein YndB with AHSA1/START domain
MGTVTQSIDIAAEPSKVWAIVGDFNGLPAWNQGLASSALEEGGKVRYLVRRVGGHVRERLIERDDARRLIRYSMFETGLPVSRHMATMQVTPKGKGSTMTWSCEFESKGPPDTEVAAIFQQIFAAGLSSLKTLLENGC